jgi:hypothetical protein
MGLELRALGGSRRAEPTVAGAFLVIVGAFLSGGVFFFINLRYTRQLSKNTEDLHGSARWANEDDVKNTGLLDAEQGVYVGGWHDEKTRHLYYLRHNGPEHVLAFAPSPAAKLASGFLAHIFPPSIDSCWLGFRGHASPRAIRSLPFSLRGLHPLAETRSPVLLGRSAACRSRDSYPTCLSFSFRPSATVPGSAYLFLHLSDRSASLA